MSKSPTIKCDIAKKAQAFKGGDNCSRFIGLVGRVLANGLGHLGSIPGHVIPKTLNMVLDASLLNTQRYKVRIKGKLEQSREKSSAIEKGAFWSPSTTVANFTYLYLEEKLYFLEHDEYNPSNKRRELISNYGHVDNFLQSFTTSQILYLSSFIWTVLMIYIYTYIYTTLWVKCSPTARQIEVQFQVESYQSFKKWYLIPPCLILIIIR